MAEVERHHSGLEVKAAGDGGEPPGGDGAPGDGLLVTREAGGERLGPGQTEQGRLQPQAERLQ